MRALVTGLVVAGSAAAIGTAGLLAFTYRQAHKLLRPYRKPMAFHPHELGLPFEEITCQGSQGTLCGWYLPASNGCTIVCCHGIHDNAVQWAEQVARLHARSGYGALLFDFAGHGRSGGTMVTYGIREQADIQAALDYLRSRGDVDMTRIGLMGYSLGAIAGVLFAADHPEIRALVIESGFADLLRDMAVLFHRFTGLPAFPFAHLVVWWAERIAGARLAEIRPVQVVGRISPRAVMLISDLQDTLADEPYDGEHLYLAAGAPKQLWQVPDAKHVQAYNVRPDEWVERVGAFLDEHLSGHHGGQPSGVETASVESVRDAEAVEARIRSDITVRRRS